VVSFKEQNGKIFVFDTDDRKNTSDTFSPEVVVDAWPIVRYRPFEERPGASDYVLVDVTKGLNRFSVVGDWYGSAGSRFNTEVAYMQRFRDIDDGAHRDAALPCACSDPARGSRSSSPKGWAGCRD
jgi:hypothetical protein